MKSKIVILNGDPESGRTPVNKFLGDFRNDNSLEEAEVKIFDLRNLKVRQCVGCFDCWLKTPGKCRFEDDAEPILREIIHADLLIFASSLIMGMYSAVLKRFQDRMLPILHPYLELVNNECHHRKRYPSYPDLGFIYFENDATQEEIDNVRFIHERMSLNMHADFLLFKSVSQITPKEFSHEISHL